MNEKKLIKKQLIKNMLYSFIAFSIIFTIFGVIIFNNLKQELYKSVDNELILAKQRYLDGDSKEIKPKIENKQTSEELPPEMKEPTQEQIERISTHINPRVIYIVRDDDGEVTNSDSIGRFYDEYNDDIEFNTQNIDVIYEMKINNYIYRTITFESTDEDGQEKYVQLLINVDAEKNIIDNYLNILTLGIITTIILSILASYGLSKIALKPIIASWEKQTEFVQNASHELRTPLTIIQAKQELLLQEPNSKIIDKSEDIRLSLNESKRLAKLTKDLMLLARADSNTLELNKEKVYIDKLMQEIAVPYIDFANIENKKIILNLQYNREALIDVNKFHQLMVILLDNSIKYTEERRYNRNSNLCQRRKMYN